MTFEEILAWLNANGAAISTIAAVTTAMVATVALWHTTSDSRERTRPIVLAEFRMAQHSRSTIDLVVRNAGATVARDVRVRFDPSPEIPDDGEAYMARWLLQRYREPIPSLAPGQELSNIWFSGQKVDGAAEMVNHEPTADQVRITISYRRSGRRRYKDTFPLDVDLIRMQTHSTSSRSIPGRIAGIEEALKGLQKSSNEIAKAARYLRRSEIEEEEADLAAMPERIRKMEAENQAELQRMNAPGEATT